MKKTILGLMIIIMIFLIGCEGVDLSKISQEDVNKVIACEKPYIRFGASCCFDNNDNGICDNDEKKEPICQEKQVPYETTETYTEMESYNDNEVYTVNEPYQENVCNNIQVPYTTTEEKSKTLFVTQQGRIMSPGENLFSTNELTEGTTVYVSFKADGTLNLWAFDEDEYQKIIENSFYVSDQYLLKRTDVSSSEASFKIPTKDNYVIYLKNPHILDSVKVFEFTATAKWNEVVTKTKTEQKCEMVTKYRTVEKTKVVTKTQPVTKTRPVTKYKTETVCE